MPLEVIGAGFGRTGTTSVQMALNVLYEKEGGSCYHYGSIMTRPDHARMWMEILSGKLNPEEVDWEVSFFGRNENFVATMDHPCADYYKEMMESYPKAKVILTYHPRGREGWYRSKLGHTAVSRSLNRWPLLPITNFVVPIILRALLPAENTQGRLIPACEMRALARVTEYNVWGERGFADAENALDRYDKWYAGVKKTVPSERLLEFDVSMGWGPLCNFLGKPVPDVPFPKEDSHSSARIKRIMKAAEMCAWALYAGLAVICFTMLKTYFLAR